ncbi:TPA: type III-B CRISPR-associated protein Cas10/Cmr2, partial [Clostridium botulinum]
MTQNKKSYIGVTIGPIYKTIQLAKHTGELWASSYMFSYIMKNIIKEILKEFEDKNIKNRFIVPYVGQGYEDKVFKDKYEAGLFHDRFIFQSEENEVKKVNKIIEDVKQEFSEKVYQSIYDYYKLKKDLNSDELEKDENKFIRKLKEVFKQKDGIENRIKNYIKEYFQIYSVEVDIDEDSDKNVIFEVSKYLDTVELNEKFINYEDNNYLSYFLKNVIIKKSFLVDDAFEKPFNAYPSLANIAMRDLGVTEENYSSEDKLKKDTKDIRRKIHNYVAIIQVDGDNVGRIISNLKENGSSEETFEGFSKRLYEHAKNSVKTIKEYGGLTLYAGGDDLLFIAPVINKLSKNDFENVFELMDNLSERFEAEFKKNDDDKIDEKGQEEQSEKDNDKPTLSFGVSIVHYKYPLYEALNDTVNLLFNYSKNYGCFLLDNKNNTIYSEKNAISFKVIKHSGQYYGLTLNKRLQSYDKFKSILKKEIDNFNKSDETRKGIVNNLKSISNRV